MKIKLTELEVKGEDKPHSHGFSVLLGRCPPGHHFYNTNGFFLTARASLESFVYFYIGNTSVLINYIGYPYFSSLVTPTVEEVANPVNLLNSLRAFSIKVPNSFAIFIPPLS